MSFTSRFGLSYRSASYGACGLVVTLFLIISALTWDTKNTAAMGTFILADEPGLITIHYRSRHYFLPDTFALSKGGGVRFKNETTTPLKLALLPIQSDEVIEQNHVTIPAGSSFDVRFEQKGVWKFYNEEDSEIFGHIYIR